MAKQHSDNIESRLKEAAENISFPPNEEAWRKMEALLENDKRRRPVVFWWYLLFVGLLAGAGVFTYQYFREPDAKIAANEIKVSGNRPSERGDTGDDSAPVGKPEDRSLATQTPGGGDDKNSSVPDTTISAGRSTLVEERLKSGNISSSTDVAATTVQKIKTQDISSIPKSKRTKSGTNYSGGFYNSRDSRKRNLTTNPGRNSQPTLPAQNDQSGNNKSVDGGNESNTALSQETSANSAGSVELKSDTSASVKTKTDSTAKDQTVVKNTPASENSSIKIAPSKKKWDLQKGFGFSLGARIDATDLHKISLRQFDQLAGGMISYRFSNRLSLQTGLFIQKAIYYAGPEDYYVKPGSYLSMYRISKIDAVCQIYDIPLNIRYDVLISKGARVFATAGMNSFYLQKENYRYHANGSSGYRMFDSTYRANKNYFSSAYFSAGIEKRITSSLSVQAEPYVKVPVSGVGAGKVKLYSGGVQLLIRYQPQFHKKSSGNK